MPDEGQTDLLIVKLASRLFFFETCLTLLYATYISKTKILASCNFKKIENITLGSLHRPSIWEWLRGSTGVLFGENGAGIFP